MTDTTPQPHEPQPDATEPLPLLITVSTAFSSRLPSQRVLDQLDQIEGIGFAALAQSQPFRIVAFRALLRDFPDRDATSLWAHAYDVEVEVEDVNPTNGKLPMPGLGSAAIGA
jgi:hypothetical protein